MGPAGSDGPLDSAPTTGEAVSSGAAAGELCAAAKLRIMVRIKTAIETTANKVRKGLIFAFLLSFVPNCVSSVYHGDWAMATNSLIMTHGN